MATITFCPCGSRQSFATCCAPFLAGDAIAPSAQALMRSRYSAYTLLNEDYLLSSWHSSTRPAHLNLAREAPSKWLSLEIKHQQQTGEHAEVEFIARYKVNGRAYRLHEISRFVRENDHWFYVDGKIDVR